tara:strand:- start:264 stop:551 length:288 start_codon:yes stop_codon:yes gene_type:complete
MSEYWKTTYCYRGDNLPSIGHLPDGQECPNPECEETGGDFDLDIEYDSGAECSHYSMECNVCGQKWREIHRITDISVLQKGPSGRLVKRNDINKI